MCSLQQQYDLLNSEYLFSTITLLWKMATFSTLVFSSIDSKRKTIVYHCWKDLLKNALNSLLRVCIYEWKFTNQRSFSLSWVFKWLPALCLYPLPTPLWLWLPLPGGWDLSSAIWVVFLSHTQEYLTVTQEWKQLSHDVFRLLPLSRRASHPSSLQVFCVRRASTVLLPSPLTPHLLLLPVWPSQSSRALLF